MYNVWKWNFMSSSSAHYLDSNVYFTGKKFSDMYQNPFIDSNNGQYPNYNGLRPCDYSQTPDENGYLPNEHCQYPDENGVYPEFRPRITAECGIVRNRDGYTLHTQTQNCENQLPFICEMEVEV